MTEEWKDVVGYEGYYKVSNYGNVLSVKTNKLMTKTIHGGTYNVNLSKDNESRLKLVHRLVAEVFVENPNGFRIVKHKDGNKFNNYYQNLEYWQTKCCKEKMKNLPPDDLSGEVWRDIEGYKGLYQISNYGRVKSYVSNPLGKILKHRHYSEYNTVVLIDKNGDSKKYMVHRLVALAFIHNPNDYPMINHIDGDKHNNLPENLEWCTQSQNAKHAYNVLYPGCLKGEGCSTSILTNETALEIFKMGESGEYLHREIAEKFGIDRSTVTDIIRGKSWSHVTGKKLVKLERTPITKELIVGVFNDTLCKELTLNEIAEKYKISVAEVYVIKYGKRFTEITQPIKDQSNTTLAEFF